jgi:hypothetical protein
MSVHLSMELFIAVWTIAGEDKIAAIKHLYGAEGPVTLGLRAAYNVVNKIVANEFSVVTSHGKQHVRVEI